MKKEIYLALAVLLSATTTVLAQDTTLVSPCSETEIMKRHSKDNAKALQEKIENEVFTKAFVEQLKEDRLQNNAQRRSSKYTIPVVLHVFHNGNDAKVGLAQAQSGIDILNTDYNGLNKDWNTIIPRFDSIKATLDIQYCLASLDLDGNATTGIVYYDDSVAMLNKKDLFQFAWDNKKYLNIYLPKYTGGSPSLFTAFAYYPSTSRTNNNTDGIFYSSIRWGYGAHSEFTPGQEWASVGTHETGHWLNLRHTFENGCNSTNDGIDDTPPTLGGIIKLTGCFNNDSSCGVSTNGSNYMDYNHDCKKMFTQGQVDRMTAALNLTSRKNLWSPANLITTGCSPLVGLQNFESNPIIQVYPNPAKDNINFEFEEIPTYISIYDVYGKLIFSNSIFNLSYKLKISTFKRGVYFYHVTFPNSMAKGKFIRN